MANSRPLVITIIVTFNGKRHLERLLPTLPLTEYSNHRIFIVDNASSDDTVSFLEANYPQYQLFKSTQNLGFAGGNNIAVQAALAADADYVFFLNNDTAIIDPLWLDALVEVAEGNPRAGFVGLREVLDCAAQPSASGAPPEQTSWISGSSMLVRADLLRDLGMMDEEYFMYGEEDDLQARGLKAGYTIWQIDRPIYHAGMGTARQTAEFFSYLQMRNSIRFVLKNKGFVGIAARVFRVADVAVNPFPLMFDRKNPEHNRIRNAGKIAMNVPLLLKAVGWNLLHLFDTLQSRRKDERRVRAACRNMS